MKHSALLIIAAFASLFSLAAVGPITGSTSGCVGSTWHLADTTLGGVWYSTDTAVATIDSATGAVTGRTAGTATIVYYISGSSYDTVTITVHPTVADSVYIVTTSPITPGIKDTFIAVPINGGSSPTYTWTVNSVIFSPNDTYSFVPAYGDIICVTMYSSLTCAAIIGWTCIEDTITATTFSRNLSLGEETIKAYPNPVKEAVIVQYDFVNNGEMYITDVMGRIMLTQKLSSANKEETVDVSKLPDGLYLYKILQNNVLVSSGKIMKE